MREDFPLGAVDDDTEAEFGAQEVERPWRRNFSI